MNDEGPLAGLPSTASAESSPRARALRPAAFGKVASAFGVSIAVHGFALGCLIALAPRVARHAGAGEDVGTAEELVAVTQAGVEAEPVRELSPAEVSRAAVPTLDPSALADPPSLGRPQPVTIESTGALPATTAPHASDGDLVLPIRRAATRERPIVAIPTESADAPQGPRPSAPPDARSEPPRDAGISRDVAPAESPPAPRDQHAPNGAPSRADAGADLGPVEDTGRPDTQPPAILTVGIQQSEHGEHTGAMAPALAGNPELAAFIANVQRPVAAQVHFVDVYRKAHPNYRDERILGRTATLLVRLSRNGTLEQATVVEPSGSAAFDQEAVAGMRRARPLPAPPGSVIDDKGGFSFRFTFHLDLRAQVFYGDVARVVAKRWQPSRAFRRFSSVDRTTVVRVLIGKNGAIVHRTVHASAGLDFLDRTALEALPVGGQLAPPPPGLRPAGHLVAVRIKFMHAARGADLVSTGRDRPEDADGPTSPTDP